MALNLHLLRLFVAVARHGGFSRAAAALHISQPAVSKGVREFEAQVGHRLLERGAGGVTLTAAGSVLLREAAPLFAAERAAEESLAELRGLRRGTLVVGASTTIATYVLPPILGAFHREHPGVALRLVSANTDAIAARLLARELDVALVEGPVDLPGIQVEPWRDEALILITAPNHRLAGRVVDAAMLSAEIMIVREPGSGTRTVAAAALAQFGVTPREMLEVGSTEAIKQVVAAGLGIALVPAASATDQIALGRLRVLTARDFAPRRALIKLSLPGRQPSAAAARFEAKLLVTR